MATNPLLLTDCEDFYSADCVRAFAQLKHSLTILPYDALALTHQGITLHDALIEPSFVLARFINHGSLEEITHKLSLLHALEAQGSWVVNSASAIERSVDKGLCCALLQKNDLPTPPHCTTHNFACAQEFCTREYKQGFDVLAKPLFGARGKNIRRLRPPAPPPAQEEVGGVWHLQRFIQSDQDPLYCRDWRLFVIDGELCASVLRRNKGWCANVSMGGMCYPEQSKAHLNHLAIHAAQSVGAFYAGVDIIEDLNGKPYILEVNSIPAWRGISSIHDIDPALHLAQAILNE